MSRRHGFLYSDKALTALVNSGLRDVGDAFKDVVEPLRILATRYFRIFDLLHGNNISALLEAVTKCLLDAEEVDLKLKQEQDGLMKWERESVDISKFVRNIREPIHLSPGVHYITLNLGEGARKIECFGFLLDTEMDLKLNDVYRQVREFLYQFALRREVRRRPYGKDKLAHDLTDSFLRDGFLGRIDAHEITRVDGFFGALVGLQCWDLVQRYRREKVKAPTESALAHMHEAIQQVGTDAIERYFKTARKNINSLPFSGSQPKSTTRRAKSSKS